MTPSYDFAITSLYVEELCFNKKVSYRKQIAHQHSFEKFVANAGGLVDPVKFFFIHRYRLITVKPSLPFLIPCAQI